METVCPVCNRDGLKSTLSSGINSVSTRLVASTTNSFVQEQSLLPPNLPLPYRILRTNSANECHAHNMSQNRLDVEIQMRHAQRVIQFDETDDWVDQQVLAASHLIIS